MLEGVAEEDPDTEKDVEGERLKAEDRVEKTESETELLTVDVKQDLLEAELQLD